MKKIQREKLFQRVMGEDWGDAASRLAALREVSLEYQSPLVSFLVLSIFEFFSVFVFSLSLSLSGPLGWQHLER